MSGAWYALATFAIALVIRWYILNDTGPSSLKEGRQRRERRSRRAREPNER